MFRRSLWGVCCVVLAQALLCGCEQFRAATRFEDTGTPDAREEPLDEPPVDAPVDRVALDSSDALTADQLDTGLDALREATSDGSDAAVETAMDASLEATLDVASELSTDAPSDAVSEGATDTRTSDSAGCAPSETRACGTGGQQTCSPAGRWCRCMGDRTNAGGTAGEWSGCRGNGLSVCADLVRDYPNYFRNHPDCTPHVACESMYFTCNSRCPRPVEEDRGMVCNGSTGGNPTGCRGNGCAVCVDLLDPRYDCYFLHHPACQRNETCAGTGFQCNAYCPPPDSTDQGVL